MRFDSFDFLVWGVLGGLLVAILGVVSAGDRVGAQILRVFPEPNSLAGATAPVGIEFGQDMQTDSVISRFQIEPDLPGAFRWQGRQLWFVPSQGFAAGQQYTIRLASGALSETGRQVRQERTWRFSVRPAEAVYLTSGAGARELWRQPLSGGSARQLTDTGGLVWDFAVARDGSQIAYSVLNENNGLDLWLVDREGQNSRLLLACDFDRCSAPAWAPDGSRLAYHREPAALNPGERAGPSRIWLVDLARGETVRLFEDPQKLGYTPSWSPDGSRLAFVDPNSQGIRVLEMATGEELFLPTAMGRVGGWTPDSRQIFFTNM